MNVQDILAIAALGIVGGSIATKKRKQKKKEKKAGRCRKRRRTIRLKVSGKSFRYLAW